MSQKKMPADETIVQAHKGDATTRHAATRRRAAIYKFLEVALMPLVVALVGGLATFAITYYQTKNSAAVATAQMLSAERLASAQQAAAEKSAQSDRELKALELFSHMIVSESSREREMAVRMLSAVNGDLATRLAKLIQGDEKETPSVRDEAKRLIDSPALKAVFSLTELQQEAKRLEAVEYDIDGRTVPLTAYPSLLSAKFLPDQLMIAEPIALAGDKSLTLSFLDTQVIGVGIAYYQGVNYATLVFEYRDGKSESFHPEGFAQLKYVGRVSTVGIARVILQTTAYDPSQPGHVFSSLERLTFNILSRRAPVKST
jgi:hypothetical protein